MTAEQLTKKKALHEQAVKILERIEARQMHTRCKREFMAGFGGTTWPRLREKAAAEVQRIERVNIPLLRDGYEMILAELINL